LATETLAPGEHAFAHGSVVAGAVVVAAGIVVAGAARFPPPPEQPATRSATAATNANTERRFERIVISMTLSDPWRFPDRGLRMSPRMVRSVGRLWLRAAEVDE